MVSKQRFLSIHEFSYILRQVQSFSVVTEEIPWFQKREEFVSWTPVSSQDCQMRMQEVLTCCMDVVVGVTYMKKKRRMLFLPQLLSFCHHQHPQHHQQPVLHPNEGGLLSRVSTNLEGVGVRPDLELQHTNQSPNRQNLPLKRESLRWSLKKIGNTMTDWKLLLPMMMLLLQILLFSFNAFFLHPNDDRLWWNLAQRLTEWTESGSFSFLFFSGCKTNEEVYELSNNELILLFPKPSLSLLFLAYYPTNSFSCVFLTCQLKHFMYHLLFSSKNEIHHNS